MGNLIHTTVLVTKAIEDVADGKLVYVGGEPSFDRERDDWNFIGIASPSEGGVRYGPESTLYKLRFVLVPTERYEGTEAVRAWYRANRKVVVGDLVCSSLTKDTPLRLRDIYASGVLDEHGVIDPNALPIARETKIFNGVHGDVVEHYITVL